MVPIPPEFLDLFKGNAMAHLATIMPDGSPQVTPVWVELAPDGYLLMNSAKGRIKDRNMRARPQVALELSDPKDPYRYIAIRGQVVEMKEEGAVEDNHRLSRLYLGVDFPYPTEGQTRVTYRVEPLNIHVRTD